jgi:hypothetical protein
MYSPELTDFIYRHSSLFWYIPEDQKGNVSPELLIETIMNYAEMDSVKELIKLMGINRIAEVFYGLNERQKLNYYPEIFSFLSLIIKKYAVGIPDR